MAVTFYGLKSCDTCRKALKALEGAGVAVTVVDVRADGIAPDVLATLIADVGREVLVNTRSTTWRGLDDTARAKAETDAGTATLLTENPTLMKRPVIVADGVTHVGWTKDVQAALLG